MVIEHPLWAQEIERCSGPQSHAHQQTLHFLICALVFLGCLLDNLTGRIAYAEPSDLAAIFRAQHDYARYAHQIQAVAVAEKRLPAVVVGHGLPYTLETTELITQIAYFCFVHTVYTVRQVRTSTSPHTYRLSLRTYVLDPRASRRATLLT